MEGDGERLGSMVGGLGLGHGWGLDIVHGFCSKLEVFGMYMYCKCGSVQVRSLCHVHVTCMLYIFIYIYYV